MHVSAKDLGTGREQSIAITASSNMSEEEIKKAVHEAEQYAAEDKKKKDEVETINRADQLIYQTERTMKEMEGKLDEMCIRDSHSGRLKRRSAACFTPWRNYPRADRDRGKRL